MFAAISIVTDLLTLGLTAIVAGLCLGMIDGRLEARRRRGRSDVAADERDAARRDRHEAA